jgi:hypothetical protein
MEIEEGIIVVILLFILAMVIGWLIALSASYNEDEKAWLQFRREHHCRMVGEITGGYKTPPKTGWLCDNGMTYWR